MKTVIIFIIAAVIAGGYFYSLDKFLMEMQGLEIGMNLMPLAK